jgi:tight adherence protein B
MGDALVLAAVFLSVVLGCYGLYALVVQGPQRVQERATSLRLEALMRAQERGARDRSVEVFKQEILDSLPALRKLLLRMPRARSLERALRQADWGIPVTTFVLLSVMAAGAAAAVATLLWRGTAFAVVAAVLGGTVPYLVLVVKRRQRMDRFLEQLPEAIDLLARAVRAGHAVPTGFEMVGQDTEPPLGPEFRQIYDEQKFGLPMDHALANLQERVPILDVRMLATAITIQREVGGNLAELLDKIAETIRERRKIRGQLKVYTAQGRLTGYILAVLPVFVGLLLLALDRTYFEILFEHRLGMLMIALSLLLQIVGYFWIRKIMDIKI